MKKNQKVQIRKLTSTGNPLAPTPPKEGYQFGKLNHHVSLPNDYTAKGVLIEDVEVGKDIVISRSNRNGVEIEGIFHTTPVVEIKGNKIHTKNSIYEITEIE